MLELTYDENRLIAEMVEQHNTSRLARGLPLLHASVKLDVAALQHAQWMAARHRLSHYQGWFFGSSPASRARSVGYSFRSIAENIATGSAQEAMRNWRKSPGHNDNIFNENFRDIGVGVARSSRTGVLYWCVVFGAQARKESE